MACNDVIMADIVMSCDNQQIGGYTGRAVLVPYSLAPSIVTDSTNVRKVKSITLSEAQKFVKVDNVVSTPFDGSNKASNADTGRVKYVKTFSIRIPLRGADASMKVVEPLVNSPLGFLLVVEKRQKTQDGGFEVIGLQSALRIVPDSVAGNENENDGDTTLSLSTTETYYETTFVGSGNDYATALSEFEEMYTNTLNS